MIINVVLHVIHQNYNILMQIVKHVLTVVMELHIIGHHGVKNV